MKLIVCLVGLASQIALLPSVHAKIEYSIGPCATSIHSWADCKVANSQLNKVPIKHAFSNNDWSYGCLLIDNALFFNSKVGAVVSATRKSKQKTICARMNYNHFLESAHNFDTGAKATRGLTNVALDARVVTTNAASYGAQLAVDGIYLFTRNHAWLAHEGSGSTLTLELSGLYDVVAIGAAAAWPFHIPSKLSLHVGSTAETVTWSSDLKRVQYMLWKLKSPIKTKSIRVDLVNGADSAGLTEFEVWSKQNTRLAGSRNAWNPALPATHKNGKRTRWNEFYCSQPMGELKVTMGLKVKDLTLDQKQMHIFNINQCTFRMQEDRDLQFKRRTIPVCSIKRGKIASANNIWYSPDFAQVTGWGLVLLLADGVVQAWCLDYAKSKPSQVCNGQPNGCSPPARINNCNIVKVQQSSIYVC